MVQEALEAPSPVSINLIMREDLTGMKQASKYQGMQARISIVGTPWCVCVSLLRHVRARLILSGPGAKTSRGN